MSRGGCCRGLWKAMEDGGLASVSQNQVRRLQLTQPPRERCERLSAQGLGGSACIVIQGLFGEGPGPGLGL
jgi:hypothetical protein